MTDNTKLSKNYCVILAGGKGRRLWPCSREERPKQFIDFFGTGRTQLQQTYDRMLKVIPEENILVSTNVQYEHFVKEQLPNLREENILVEPIHRNTAPSVAWACHRAQYLCPEANIIVTPSDQAVFKEENFEQNILEGMDFVDQHEGILIMGVRPTRPEPGYGYIQMSDETEVSDLYKVQSFTEKPDRNFAQMFIDSGEFLWNTGILLFNVDYMVSLLRQILPKVICNLLNTRIEYRLPFNNNKKGVYESHEVLEAEKEYMKLNFARYPNLSIDYGILEKSDKVYVKLCDFGWADLGTWHSTYEGMSRSDEDNVIIDSKVIVDEAKNNIIKVPHDHLAIVNGLEGYIIAEHNNVLLICKKEDSSARIRKYINEVKLKYGDDFV